jgi:hypothetical protein
VNSWGLLAFGLLVIGLGFWQRWARTALVKKFPRHFKGKWWDPLPDEAQFGYFILIPGGFAFIIFAIFVLLKQAGVI